MIFIEKKGNCVAIDLDLEKERKAKEREYYEVYQDWQVSYAKGITQVEEATQSLIDIIDQMPIFETLNPLYKEALNELVNSNDDFSEGFYELIDEMEEFPDKMTHEFDNRLDQEGYIDSINNEYFCELYDFVDEDEEVGLPEETTTAIVNIIRQIKAGFELLLSAHGLA